MNYYSYEYLLDLDYEFGSHSHRALEGSDTKKVLTGHISGVPPKELFAKHMVKQRRHSTHASWLLTTHLYHLTP
jgi:hypothetical protein